MIHKMRTHLEHPSTKAKVAFWVGIANSGGLMLLGAYCLKGAVDAQSLHAAGIVVATLAMAWR
jgi:hypothetical protein